MLYGNMGNQPQISTILYVQNVQTWCGENAPLASSEAFQAVVKRHGATAVMFHASGLPRRAVPVEKAQPYFEKWLRSERRMAARRQGGTL